MSDHIKVFTSVIFETGLVEVVGRICAFVANIYYKSHVLSLPNGFILSIRYFGIGSCKMEVRSSLFHPA